MNSLTRMSVCLAIAAMALTAVRHASAQYVAYQPVVVPTDPALISGWYPGKLLDTWAANRRTYRAATLAPTLTATPVTSYYPVTSYRPVSSVAYPTTSYMPVRTYRAYYGSPYVTTTAYSAILTTSTVCCDPCATATVTNYAASAACCGTSVSNGGYYGEITPQPELPGGPVPREAGRPESPPDGNGSTGGTSDDDSVLDNEQDKEQEDDANGAQGDPASFQPPPLRDQRLEALPDDPANQTAQRGRPAVTEAAYRQSARPDVATTGGRTPSTSRPSPQAMPSRAEREAMWTPVKD